MVKHIEVPASKAWWEMIDGNTPACSLFAEARLRTMRDASVDAGLRADLPIVLHTRALMNPRCDNYDTVQELACSGSSCGGANWAAIDAYKVVDFNQYVISHELGHVLGLPDLQQSTAICSNGSTHLMCQLTSRQSANLQGGPSGASCEIARSYAATYARRYYDTAGTDFSGGDY